jgi:rhamnosyltransferase
MVDLVIQEFKKDLKLGIFYPEPFPKIKEKLSWGDNEHYAKKLLEIFNYNNLDIQDNPEFPSGSMFYFRPAALLPIFQRQTLTYNDFPDGYVVNGSLAHAMERLFTEISEREGFGYMVKNVGIENRK